MANPQKNILQPLVQQALTLAKQNHGKLALNLLQNLNPLPQKNIKLRLRTNPNLITFNINRLCILP